MSVWPPEPTAVLSGSDGALVSISIEVNPRLLESLLEALARLSFPVNPQVYHEAETVYRYADGHEEAHATTLVEFPAYAGQLKAVREALAAFGFDPASLQVTRMLAEIHGEPAVEPAPPGAPYVECYRRKFRVARAGSYQP